MNDSIRTRVAQLTTRQRQVVRLVSLGCTIEEMAAILDLAPSTVDNHRSGAMKALGINRTALLARVAIKHRISNLNDRLTRSEKLKSGRNRDGWN